MKEEIKSLKAEVESLKKTRPAQVLFSSTSSGSSKVLGDSSKQGRKLDEGFKDKGMDLDKDFAELDDSENTQAKDDDAEIKGRKLDFDDIDVDADFGFDDTVGTTQLATERQEVPTASEKVTTAEEVITTADEEVARKQALKGKAIVTYTEPEPTRKISKKEKAQIDYDARLAEHLADSEVEKKKKLEENEVASFMEAKRLDKLEAEMAQPLSVVPTIIMH